MARAKVHSTDGEIEKFEIVFTPSGPQLVEVFQSWEFDDQGQFVRREPPRREVVDPAVLTPQERGLLTSLAALRTKRQQARFG